MKGTTKRQSVGLVRDLCHRVLRSAPCLLALPLLGSPREGHAQDAAYVANWGANSVSVIALETTEPLALVEVGLEPYGVAALPDGSRVYVTNTKFDEVSVLGPLNPGTVVTTIPVGSAPTAVAVRPDGQRVYVANRDNQSIAIIDPAPNAVVDTFWTSAQPNAITFHSTLGEVWIGFSSIGTVLEVFSTADHSLLASRISNNRPYGSHGLVFTPDGSLLYGSEQCGCCGRFHQMSGTLTDGTITILTPDLLYNNQGDAAGLAVHPVTGMAYLLKRAQCSGQPYLIEYDGALGRRLNLDAPPAEAAITANGDKLYVVNRREAGSLSEIDTSSLTVTRTASVGRYPWGIALAGRRPEPLPELQIQNAAMLSWPLGYDLFEGPIPSGPWSPVTAEITVVGNENRLFVLPQAPQRHYRLEPSSAM